MANSMRDSLRGGVRISTCFAYACEDPDPDTFTPSVTWLFLSFDILCLFIQSAGGGIASTSNINQARIGSDIALVGIAAQTGMQSSFLFECPSAQAKIPYMTNHSRHRHLHACRSRLHLASPRQ